MSSRSPTFSERLSRAAAALLLALSAALWHGAAPAAAAVPLPVAAVLTGAGQTCLVVDLGAGARPGARTVTVTRDGVPQDARLVPVVSEGLAVALVVDTAAAGAATLPAWLSAGARFVLEAPAGTPAVVVADTAPAAVIAGPGRGPVEIVGALQAVRPGGARDTAAALTLAARQFPDAALGRRVVVLYTTAPDAGGESAAALGERLRATGTLLVVVGTAASGRYWTDAAAATGGFFAPAGDPVVVPALDQVQATLRGRHLVQFPTPEGLPARVSVRVVSDGLTLTGDAVVTAAPPAAAPRGSGRPAVILAALAAGGLALAGAALMLLRRRRRPGDPASATPEQSPDRDLVRPVARGRAAVPGPGTPGAVARGRAVVPHPAPPPPADGGAGRGDAQ